MSSRFQLIAGLSLFMISAGTGLAARGRESQPTTQLTVHSGQPGCQVEVDAQSAGKTDTAGALVVKDIEPGDHYLHVHCPGHDEAGYLITLSSGQNLEFHAAAAAPPVQVAKASLDIAETRTQLQQLVVEAVHLRDKGRLEEAVEKLRQALKLDPENSDLHHELGITFLLSKDWKRGRIELIEAIRHDPNDAGAHNGLGYALEKLGDLDAALKEYRNASHLEPDDPTYRTHYFDALSKLAQRKAKTK